MLPVDKTAFEGAGLSIPCVIIRKAEPYMAIPASGPMPELPEFAPPKFAVLHDWLRDRGVGPVGPGLFRYRRFGGDGSVVVEVGNMVAAAVAPEGEVIAGEIPAGRYAFAVHSGPYDRLHDAFLMLEGWMGGRGLTPDGAYDRDGSAPACQAEIYRVTPMEENDPRKWRTEIFVKLAD